MRRTPARLSSWSISSSLTKDRSSSATPTIFRSPPTSRRASRRYDRTGRASGDSTFRPSRSMPPFRTGWRCTMRYFAEQADDAEVRMNCDVADACAEPRRPGQGRRRPQNRDSYAAAELEGTGYGSLLSQGRPGRVIRTKVETSSTSPRPENFIERRLHLLLLLGRGDRERDFLLLQNFDDAWRIRLDVAAGRQAAFGGEELL